METETQATLVAALATGYALGRTKKGKLAIGVASALAGQGLLSPRELMTRALSRASENPQTAQLLDQVRGELMDSARTALSTTADRRLGALATSLQERTEALLGQPDGEGEEEETPEDQEDQEDQEAEQEAEAAPPRRSRARKSPAKKSATRTAPAKQTPAKKAPAKKAPAKKAPTGKKKADAGRTSGRGSRRR
ncbi:hypothetical protein ACGF3J_16235 [Streptomyces sp. NPDC048171]|uniref:hypothetical protein n=1 Tax=unclassified Streptomyces TaxID=2593676 RepID=UPI00136D786D|nr:hypothetical protein [Streptomyces sp. SID5789]MZE70361.1 hypothetical protein [Streptomyces sp. SID5789]